LLDVDDLSRLLHAVSNHAETVDRSRIAVRVSQPVIDAGQVMALTLVDLSLAFDTVDHSILAAVDTAVHVFSDQ